MTLGRRPTTQSRRTTGGGFPPWLVFLLAIALVFGSYYLWIGVRGFLATGGLGIVEGTQQAVATETATAFVFAQSRRETEEGITPLPTFTPIPECIDFVTTARANVRVSPDTSGLVVEVLEAGAPICVLQPHAVATDWYMIDLNPQSRRINEAYIFGEIVEALNPTPTPSMTFTPAPTVTPMPTDVPTISPTPRPTATPDPDWTDTPTPTPTATPTLPVQSA